MVTMSAADRTMTDRELQKIGDIVRTRADMVVVNLFEGVKTPGEAAAAVDRAIGGAIAAAVRDGDFRGKWGETLVLRPADGIVARRVSE